MRAQCLILMRQVVEWTQRSSPRRLWICMGEREFTMVDHEMDLTGMDAPGALSAGYSAVYVATPNSPTLRRLWHENAEGLDFPEEFAHISFVTLDQLRRMANALGLGPSSTLVDLGCGRAGPALWMARETGARLIGVDFSAVAVQQAGERANTLGVGETARFVVGTFAETGLDDAVADGVISEDALQYAPDKGALFAEAARITKRGGRFVFTAFEIEAERVQGLPVFGTDPVADFRPLLEQSGFRVDTYEETPGWLETVTSTYSAILAARESLDREMGEAASAALATELSLTLNQRPYRSRVFVAATRL
jgi:ubiquinone/menaquinone biosynthesis C-methylase UbiE